MNPCSVYTIKMAASVFGNVHWSSCYWPIIWCDDPWLCPLFHPCETLRIRTIARPHVAGTVRTFLDTENVQLLPWPVRSPDLSSIENIWSIVAQRPTRHHTPVTTFDEMWHGV
ncbi:hypothetical protein TNCV_4853801 [Trichonephila clavipes]|nr:hypothetical protein TNCV_4853801 [Trichonephila clavipes]